MADYTLICCVVNVGQASRVFKCAEKYGVQTGEVSIGWGMVHSHLLEFLQFNEVSKEIITMVAKSDKVSEILKSICEEMEINKPNHGIVFTHHLAEVIGGVSPTVSKSDEIKTGDSMYKVIYTIVQKGHAEDVIEAATMAGARGGTIVNARGAGPHDIEKRFSVVIEPEREKVFIITPDDKKDAIVDSIISAVKIGEPDHGILYVLDVDEVYGLHKD